MKKRVLLMLCFLGVWGTVPTGSAVVDRIAAVVNQEIIMLSDVEKYMAPLNEDLPWNERWVLKERIQMNRQKALEFLIEEKLIDGEAKRAGVKVNAQDVEAGLEEIRKKNGLSKEQLERVVVSEGITLEYLKSQIEKKIQRGRVIQWSVKVDAKPAEKELKEFYQRNADRYRVAESYRPAHILFLLPKDAAAEQVQETRKKCQKVLDRIKAGEDFGEMALGVSEDASAKDRGDLGFFKKGDLVPAFEKEALRLKVGEVGGILRTDLGFHIIKLIDRQGGLPQPFEKIRDKVQEDYYEAEREKAYKQFVSTLKEKSVIEIKL
jgi:peptidyl-prolyl cis-trans isomerase SurA